MNNDRKPPKRTIKRFAIDWMTTQPRTTPLTCLEDGYDGVWNIINEVAIAPERREILDWYHLNENFV